MNRMWLAVRGTGISVLVAIAFTLGTMPAVSTDDPAYYNIGLAGDPDQRPGDRFHGAHVLSVNHAIDLLSVRTNNPQGFEQRAANDPNVVYISQDRPDAVRTFFVPNDPYAADQWAWGPTPGIDAYSAWDVTRGSLSITVAVLDTGLEKSHEDVGNYLQGYDFINDDADPDDQCGHGTHVAGTVGAITDNGVGVAGTAETTILPVKVLDKWRWTCAGSFSAIANGITYATDQGADVISLSLGCDQPCSDPAVSDALAYATSHDVLAVCAAGNSGGGAVGFPAADPNCMAVSALDPDGTFASYSSQGPEVEIAAPGTDILSTYKGNTYAFAGGTSMATPHVSGTAALTLATDASLTAAALRDHLKATAVDLGLPAEQQGAGALNAANAVGGSGSDGGTTNSPPTASFSYTCTDLTCAFDASDSSDSDGSIASYAWDFGDGATGSGATVDHTYANGGMYTVTVTVTDDDGATDADSQEVSVTEPASGGDGFTLSATGYKVRGLQKADLTWSGATSTDVDVYRDGSLIATTANDGAYTDHIDQRGDASYTYQVCEAGTQTCSNEATADV